MPNMDRFSSCRVKFTYKSTILACNTVDYCPPSEQGATRDIHAPKSTVLVACKQDGSTALISEYRTKSLSVENALFSLGK